MTMEHLCNQQHPAVGVLPPSTCSLAEASKPQQPHCYSALLSDSWSPSPSMYQVIFIHVDTSLPDVWLPIWVTNHPPFSSSAFRGNPIYHQILLPQPLIYRCSSTYNVFCANKSKSHWKYCLPKCILYTQPPTLMGHQHGTQQTKVIYPVTTQLPGTAA